MSESVTSSASGVPVEETAAGIVADRWPMLARALGQYQRETAEAFSRLAYERVAVGGIIRASDRAALGAIAENMGIRDFDAQLLIACALRKWVLDRHYDPKPSPLAPALSFEYKAWRRGWVRAAIFIGFAVALDGVILWKWLG